MTLTRSIVAGAFAGLLLTTGAFAQAAPPAPAAPAPAAATPAAAPAAGMDKKAISKACYDQATTQGLHGKARKAFHSKCKRDKMKGM